MTKQHYTYPIFLLVFSFFICSCDTLRKGPSESSSRNNPRPSPPPSGNSRVTASRPPVNRTPARKPAPSNRTNPSTPAKPTYTRPSGTYAGEIPKVVEVARTYSGTPYRSGGNDKSGIDCSGLICSVYSEIGVKVPRISWQQSEFGSEVGSIQEIKPGDWLFFVPEAGKEGYVSHAGIVTDVRSREEIIFIHASTSRGVREDNLFSTYFKGRFVKAMRPF
ncbi:C40 family peptidase [Dyadobacter psychrotolerans]|uniref:NlpC/P60 family protein n=1 Tax=Dyadobacter psychrotolerans TaxID=2541721 RepID=A0A4R5DZ64_9BACT|nr:C40 family peptidase [Dyadobacter psychrotolerans]TDE16725.1 NlpC/P60 family protein [Dyadobacter psychrotolerans]